jgi:uncharacterized protein (DUF885 family)
MNHQLRQLGLLGLFALAAACNEGGSPQAPSPTASAPQASIDDFFREFTDEWVRRDPNLAIQAQYFDGDEQDRLSRELTPVSREYSLARIGLAEEGLVRLAAFDRDALTPSQRVSADVMQWQLQSISDGAAFLDYAFPLQQMNGVNVNVPNELVVVHPIRTARDAENYVARLSQVDERMAEAAAESERQAGLGIVPPRFILDATIAQMERFIDSAPAENPLVTELDSKMRSVDEIDAARRDALRAEAAAVVERDVYPAWRAAIAVLEAQRPAATDDAGLWRFERGAPLYAQRLRTFTTTELTAEEIHAIGLAEVDRLEAEMDLLFRELGYTDGTIAEREAKLNVDLRYPPTPEGRERIMADIDEILADALRRTDASFDVRPETPVIAQPYPEFRWANAAASYSSPPADGSRPGIFQMPLRPNRMTKFGLRNLVYHETVPGHHFQIALATENQDLPAFRRIRAFGNLSASSEGWGLYSERFAAEDGWYEGDRAGLLGQLSGSLWRARRLVVDTGIHAMGWTRQQAIDYGVEASEVERYVVYPGQACAYMIGQLELVGLRDQARSALGDRFSIREFHNVVLGLGTVPLDVLEREVDRYVTASRTTSN